MSSKKKSADKNPWKRRNTKVIYDNPWVTVHHDEVITPGGSDGIYGRVHYKNLAVGIIPLDEEQNTWIVGQYRYPLDIYSWEIPEGGSLHHTDSLDSAKRELKEETGLTASEWTELMTLHTSNSVSDEKAIIYLAQELNEGPSAPEDTEELVIRKLPFSEVVKMVHRGEITDAMSVAGVLKLAHILSTKPKQL